MNELERFRQLGERIMSPRDTRYEEAHGVIGNTTQHAPAWERMAVRGFIPDSWLGDDTRLFAREPFPAKPQRTEPKLSANPPSIEAIATIAGNAQGVLNAEAHATEWYGRHAALNNLPPLAGFIWRVIPVTSDYTYIVRDQTELWLASSIQAIAVATSGADYADYYMARATPAAVSVMRRRDEVNNAIYKGVEARNKRFPFRQVGYGFMQGMMGVAADWVMCDEASRCGALIEENRVRWERVMPGTPYSDILLPQEPNLCVWEDGFAIANVVTKHPLFTHGGTDVPHHARIVMIAASGDIGSVPGSSRSRRR